MSKPPVDFFTKEAAQGYDQRNSQLSKISECMHFLMALVLKELPVKSKVLCVGAGTGAEILSLSRIYPQWSFVALDPSVSMLEVCRERVQNAGVSDRCEFVHGYIQDLQPHAEYDAVLSILVAHFVNREERSNFYQQMVSRLKPGGQFVNAEISFDLDSVQFPGMLKNWESVQKLMGGTPESLAGLPKQLREMLTVLPPSESEDLIQKSGISVPVRFFQAFMICAWHGVKA